jgi:hypothetical protein
MLTSDWHKLMKPVLPHASTDKELPHLRRVRLELGPRALYAIATDTWTLAAERYPLEPKYRGGDWPPVHVDAAEIKASLALLKFTDLPLEVIVDEVPMPLGGGRTVTSRAVTVQRPEDGLKLVMRDRRDPFRPDALSRWQAGLTAAFTRPRGRALDGLDLRGWALARWQHAARGGERLRLWTGRETGDPLLITVEDHFAGLATTQPMLDDPSQDRSSLPWAAELLPEGIGDGGELLPEGGADE